MSARAAPAPPRSARRWSAVGAVVLGASTSACDEPSWGLEAIDGMRTPVDPPLSCPVELPVDSRAAAREACTYGAGASAAQTLGIGPSLARRIPVRHIVVVMKENRSFDHLLGRLRSWGQPDAEAVPEGYSNVDPHGEAVFPHRAATTCIGDNPDHQWDATHADVDGGAMDGFVRVAAASTDTRGHFAISRYEPDQLPFEYWLAGTFAVADRHFASACSGTDPNRDFLLFGTNAGIRETSSDTPDPSTPSIFRALMNAGYTWGAYSDGFPLGNALAWDADDPGVHPLSALFDALDRGTLPNVAFVDGIDSVDDDNPPSDLQVGEAWLRRIYRHAVASPQWPRMAIFWTYDEPGGFADHVPPPSACVPDGSTMERPYTELGPRVPFVAISPYAKPHFVSHVVQDHTAITRFVELVFGLPALTARDANSGALLDLFDFSCAPALLRPETEPRAGTRGCTP